MSELTCGLQEIDKTASENVLRRLLVSSALVSTAVAMYQFVLPLFLYEQTKSASAMANVRAIEFVPNVIFAPIIGLIVDRLNKKSAHQFAVLAQIFLVALLVTLIFFDFGFAGIWTIYPIAFLLMTFGYVNDNVRMVIVKQHIAKSDLTLANSRLVSVWTVVGISAPALAGMLLGFVSYGVLLAGVAGLLMLASRAIRGLPQDPPQSAGSSPGLIRSFREGIQILFKNKALLQICIMVLVMNVAQGIVDANLAFLLKDRFSSSNFVVGSVATMAGVGAFLGSLCAPKIRERLGIGRLFRTCFFLNAMFYLPAALFPSPVSFALTILGTSFLGMLQSICVWTFRQESTGAEYIGRVSGLTSALFKLGLPFGLFLSGVMVSRFESGVVFLVAATLHLILFSMFRFSRVAEVS